MIHIVCIIITLFCILENGGQVNADAAQDLEQVLSGSIAAKLESA